MKQRTLRISGDLNLSVDFATKSIGILAQRRKGKTYTASVLAEECVACEIPFVALDPTGAWWGLRASADGKQEGLPVYVFGGQHASDPQMKLERTAGKEIARFVVDFPGYYVIDFKAFESKEAERQFATDFGEELYRYKQRPGKDFVQHLFVDEADMFCPQERKGVERMLGAFESIVRRGGILGLGTSLISQRTAVVNKNVLEQVDTLIVLRTVGPNDREAIRKYVVANGTPAEVEELMGSVASLRLGEAWVYEPGADPPLFERVQIRERRTFNSSATPKAGEKRVEPKKLADVEIAALRERLAASIEKGKAEDPKELTKQIRQLERELRNAKAAAATVEVEKVVEIKVPDPKLVTQLDKQAARLLDAGAKLGDLLGDLVSVLGAARAQKAPDVRRRSGSAATERTAPSAPAPSAERRAPQPPAASPASDGPLPKGEGIVLTAIVQHPEGCTREQLTVLTGYKRSTRDAYIKRLAEKGKIIVGPRISATDAGVEILGDVDPLPTGAALREYWFGNLPAGESAVLRVLVEAYPDGVNRDDITERTGYKRSTRDAYVKRLRTRELATVAGSDVFASDVLFEEGGEA